jgi:hypothetical protein
MLNLSRSRILTLIICAILAQSAASGKIIYVDANATGANNGSSWPDAHRYLQDALADANSSPKPVEIRVAQGIYKPDRGVGITLGDRRATFQLKTGVVIKCGFAGFGKPDPNARDVEKYRTILSGDLNGNDVWPYDKPHYLIINAAIGGTWGGQKGIDDTIFPQKYYIDYVRVFKIKSG